jgi:3-oxoacyl-[acyl-carrier protein] reductase
MHKAIDELGPIDILVNNAGSLIERVRIREMSEERWNHVIDLNLTSAFLCSKAVVPSMIERKSGSIINLSSIAGRNGGGLGAIHTRRPKVV